MQTHPTKRSQRIDIARPQTEGVRDSIKQNSKLGSVLGTQLSMPRRTTITNLSHPASILNPELRPKFGLWIGLLDQADRMAVLQVGSNPEFSGSPRAAGVDS
jgi:hypothetical protein